MLLRLVMLKYIILVAKSADPSSRSCMHYRHRHTDTDRQTDRRTDKQTDIHTHARTHTRNHM